MSDQIDLSKKRNRIVLALDIFLGTIFFSDCWPTEPMSSYFWRCGKTAWVKRVDRVLGDGHVAASRKKYRRTGGILSLRSLRKPPAGNQRRCER